MESLIPPPVLQGEPESLWSTFHLVQMDRRQIGVITVTGKKKQLIKGNMGKLRVLK